MRQQAIDEVKMTGLKVMDFNNPPTKEISYQPFPKCLYLHPKDKSKQHKSRLVQSEDELKQALAEGWRVEPHIPKFDERAAVAEEYEISEEVPRRGRPRKDESEA